ncbi:Fic family protein [Planobispora longispora]|nr:Fic family protein [Planobispora longispora]
MQSTLSPADRYLPWDELRWRIPPEGLGHEDWWAAVKLARAGMRRDLPLTDVTGRSFGYALPDEVLRGVETVNRHLSGQIGASALVTNENTRDRYIVSSLIEEAITSSQLEGAATTRQVAKEMLRTGRKPRTHDERMIVNNFHAMRRIGELRHTPLSPGLVCEIHRTVTADTLANPASAGRFQLPGEQRVLVSDNYGDVLHTPPPAEELPERLARLCDFANAVSETTYVPPVIRAIIVHFMLAYDHPFEDGNGRTARALFYWSMLNQGYWLTEFLSISRLLKPAPARHGRSFLHSEYDEGDLTYFIIFQLEILQRAIEDLHTYLDRKAAETQEMYQALSGKASELNHRQVAVLQHAIKHPGALYTVTSHATSHNVTPQTARTDLRGLEDRGLLIRSPHGRGHAWSPAPDLCRRLSD